MRWNRLTAGRIYMGSVDQALAELAGDTGRLFISPSGYGCLVLPMACCTI